MHTRRIEIDLGQRDASARRFPVSVSSETPVPRRDWDTGETFNEILSHARGAVDLSRAPLPVLESHDRSKVNVGIVTGLKLEGSRLRGELVLGASQRAAELAEDIAAGIVTGLSVGYSIEKVERDEKAKRITAVRWTPYEVSIVSVPADVSVGINRSHTMEPQIPQNPPASGTTPAAADPAVLVERERVDTIRSLATRHALGDAFADDLVTRGVPLADARTAILDRLAARDEATPTLSHIAITPGTDYREDFQRAAVDALLLRAGIRVDKPHAAARDVSASVYDIARICLSRSGKSASRWFGGEGRGPELLKRAAGTQDFPNILAGTLHAAVRNGYETEPASHRAWVRAVPVQDFRTVDRPILGSAPALAHVTEHGEYTHGYFTDDKASYSVAKYGKIVALTWEVLVNDNLGAFLRVQPAMGQAARRLEAGLVYDLLALNSGAGPAMQDGTNLFDAAHGNLVASAAFDATQLGKGRALLRKQTALGGGYLSLVPKYLIVGPDKEVAAEVLIANASRRVTSEKATGEWISSLELVVEPRIASTNTYLAAEPTQIDTCELGLLEENVSGPMIEEERGFNTDEYRWKVRHVAGAKFLDWRGVVRMVVT